MKQYTVVSRKADFYETFCSLSEAKKEMKKLIKNGYDDTHGFITKVWSNGDWEPMGSITLDGRNTTFCANTRQKKESYN